MSTMADQYVDNIKAPDASWQSQKINDTQNHHQQCDPDKVYGFSELENLKRTSAEHYSFVELQSKVNALSQDSSQQLNAINHYSFIREASLTEPDFWLIAEFNPPDPTLKTIADHRYPESQLPWYLAPSQSYKLKLAGWQDSNSLYRSKLSFHS